MLLLHHSGFFLLFDRQYHSLVVSVSEYFVNRYIVYADVRGAVRAPYPVFIFASAACRGKKNFFFFTLRLQHFIFVILSVNTNTTRALSVLYFPFPNSLAQEELRCR